MRFVECTIGKVDLNVHVTQINQPVNLFYCTTFKKNQHLGRANRAYPAITFEFHNGEKLKWIFKDNENGELERERNYLALLNYIKWNI